MTDLAEKSDKALAMLAATFDLHEKSAALRKRLITAEARVRFLKGEPEIPAEPQFAEIRQKLKEGWDHSLQASIRRYGDTATANALFMLGDPQV